jgi:hypothetical protein
MTLVPHCDMVVMADDASFSVPFARLGIVPEFCSSVLFPEIFGRSLANEILLLGQRIPAAQALQCGFVSRVCPAAAVLEQVHNLGVSYWSSPLCNAHHHPHHHPHSICVISADGRRQQLHNISTQCRLPTPHRRSSRRCSAHACPLCLPSARPSSMRYVLFFLSSSICNLGFLGFFPHSSGSSIVACAMAMLSRR